jgi:hypothetical protein
MKKLILAVLAAGTFAFGPIQAGAHGGWGGGYHGGWGGYHGGWGYGYRGWGYGPAFGFGVASGVVIGASLSSPWYYPYYGYGYYGGPYYRTYYAPSYYSYSAPAAQPAPAPAPAQTQPTTIINNYYYNSSPMSGANTLFGR